MAIPDFQTLMLPLLTYVADGAEYRVKDAVHELARQFHLTEEEFDQRLPSGRSRMFGNRVGWAKSHLQHAELVESVSHGVFKITTLGQSILAQGRSSIDNAFLRQFESFRAFHGGGRTTRQTRQPDASPQEEADDETETPEERMELGYQQIREALVEELLSVIKNRPPEFFEQLVVDVIVKMGYGGTREDAGRAVGRSGDGGIDGVIMEDRLGLDMLYLQAKRWANSVGSPEVQQFAGALQGRRARKGIIITTSTFTSAAQNYVQNIESKIVLIDGERLANLMIDFGVGVSTAVTYEVKRIDTDYFEGS